MHSSIKRTGLALALVAGAGAPATASAASGQLQPVLTKTVIVSAIRGRVTVEQPHARGFVHVVGPVALRVGGSVDASAGVAGVEIATPAKKWTARLSRGSAQVLQQRSGTTTFKLTGALACASPAAVTKHRPRQHRSLWVSDNGGPFASQGNYAAAGARGTEWITTDYCGRTTIDVLQGQVAVHNLATHQSATVTKGQSYTAAPVSPAAHFSWTGPEPISNGSGELAQAPSEPEEPSRRNWVPWLWGALVVLLIAGGAATAAYFISRPHQRVIPTVTGDQLNVASKVMQDAGFNVAVIKVLSSKRADTVTGQDRRRGPRPPKPRW